MRTPAAATWLLLLLSACGGAVSSPVVPIGSPDSQVGGDPQPSGDPQVGGDPATPATPASAGDPTSTTPAMPTTTVGPRYPVGPQASASCSGITVNAGDDVQSVVDANDAGTVFCFSAGTYAQQAIAPKAGDQFIGASGAVLDGENAAAVAFSSTADSIVIENLVITRYANAAQSGSIHVGGANWTVQNNEISYSSAGAGIGIDDVTGAQVVANYIHHNYQEGYSVHGTNVVFDSNEIAFNNYLQGVDWGWEAGGGKAAFTTNLLFQYNYSHDNYGPGLWTDINNFNTTYQYNRVENNATGIFHEISYDATIAHNVTKHNANAQCPGWLWCSEIQIAASGGVDSGQIEIFDNSVASTLDGRGNGISLLQQNRGTGDRGPWVVQNVWIHDNTIDLSGGGYTGVVEDISDWAIYTSRNNRYDRNHYILGTAASPFSYWDTWGDFAFWQSTGMDPNGSAE